MPLRFVLVNIQLIDEILTLLFNEFQLGSNNRSSLAQLIRSSYKSNVRKETLAWLKDEKPLIMLAEIGIEKLKKDYLYNFMSQLLTLFTVMCFTLHFL